MHYKFRCNGIAVALLSLVLSSPKVIAQNNIKNAVADSVLQLDPAVRTGKLKNGLTYFIRRNDVPQKRALFYLVNKAGSILEDENERGLAHFIEHMSFNGTRHYPKNELVSYLQKSGVRFGADINAYTSFNETVYQLPLPTDDPKLVRNGIQILRDWAQDATLKPDEINKERGVILEEARLHKGAAERMRDSYLPILLNNSKYASRIPIGTEDVITHAEPATLVKFYKKWYRPDLEAVMIVGDIDPAETEKMVKEKFSDLKNPEDELPRINYTISLTGKTQFIAVTDKEITSASAQISIKHRAQELKTVNDYRHMISQQFINQMLGIRFSGLLRSADAPFLSGNASIDNGLGGLENFTLSVSSKPEELDRGLLAAWKEVERLKRFGFEEAELTRAKRSFMQRITNTLNEKNKTGSTSLMGEYVEYFLNGTASPGIEKEHLLAKSIVSEISLTDINDLANKDITGADMDIVITGPEKYKENLLTEPDVLALMKSAAASPLDRYKVKAFTNSLLANQPQKGRIVSSSFDDKLQLHKLVLSNGVIVWLKPTNFKNDEIVFNGFAPGGTSLYAAPDYQSAAGANLIPSFGAGNYGTTEMLDYLSDKQIRVQPFINERVQGITGITTPADAGNALELLYAYLTEPRLDSVSFKNIIARSRAGIISRSVMPENIYQDTLSAIISNHNIRKTGPSLEKLNSIDMGKALSIYKERFNDASGFQFFFAGNIDSLTLYPLIETYIGGLPAIKSNTRAKDLNNSIPTGLIEKTVYKGLEQKSTVTMVYSGNFDYSFANKLKLETLQDDIQLRLIDRLREEESGVYAPKATLNISKFPKAQYSITISFGCAPGNVLKLTAAVKDEIASLKVNGPKLTDLEKVKAESRRSIETMLATNNFWVNYLNVQAQNQEDFGQILIHVKMLNEVNAENIKSAAKQYLDGKNLIDVVLMPEPKASPSH